MSISQIVLGVLLLLVAALGFFATRNTQELLTSPTTAWLCKLIGVGPARLVFMIVAAAIGVLGVLAILFGVLGIKSWGDLFGG